MGVRLPSRVTLALRCTGLPSPETRWTSYKNELNAYPGELRGEGSYAKALSMTFDLITPKSDTPEQIGSLRGSSERRVGSRRGLLLRLVPTSRLLQECWNFRHMVNLARIRKYNEVNGRARYPAVDIRSPLELM